MPGRRQRDRPALEGTNENTRCANAAGVGYRDRYRPGRAGRDQPAFFSPAFRVSVVMWIFTSSLTFGT